MHMEYLTGWSQFYTPVPLSFQLKPYLPSVESCHMSNVADVVDQNMYSDHWINIRVIWPEYIIINTILQHSS